MAGEDNTTGKPLALVFVLAVALRAAAAWASGVAAPQEIRYITIAQGMLEGRGFSGLDTRFPDIIQPPVYPALLAIALLVVPDPLVASRGVSVLAGALLVFPVWVLTRRLAGGRAARRAAWLTAVYPLLIHISGLSMTEPTFSLLVAAAAVGLHRASEGERETRHALWSGLLLGLAFLTRPEGLAYLAAAVILLALAARFARGRPAAAALRAAALPAAAFLLVAGPYWLWLRGETGRWLVAPKALLTQVHNAVMTQAAGEGWPERYGTRVFYERVKFGLNEAGTELRTDEAFRSLGLLHREGAGPGGSPVRYLAQPGHLALVVGRNLRQIYLETIKFGLVIPTLLMGLLALGVTARPWTPGPARRGHLFLLIMAVAGGSWIFSYVQPRFLYPCIVFVIPWMAEGWVRLEEWALASLGEGRGRLARGAVGPVLAAGLAAACLVHVIPSVTQFSAMWADHRTAGRRLRERGAEAGPVMALTPVVAFYAGMPFDVLPYADLDRLLAYARRKGVRYLVADMAEFPRDRPQLMSLLDPARAPEGTRVAVDVDRDPERRIVVYELGAPAAAEAPKGGG